MFELVIRSTIVTHTSDRYDRAFFYILFMGNMELHVDQNSH